MKGPLMRIPYTGPLPSPIIVPRSANTPTGAADALHKFLRVKASQPTLLLTGAGISVASGLADYRGAGGTYTLNKSYQPIYYNQFITRHESRQRYWARSFLGWTNLARAKPNAAHWAVKSLGALGVLGGVITQNVDSFHAQAHPEIPTIELHGYLRTLVCINCRHEVARAEFQQSLARLNPAWAVFLEEMLAAGALDTENPNERRAKGLRSNPDGDVHVPNASYHTFRYPPCPNCLDKPPTLADGTEGIVVADREGAWAPQSEQGVRANAGILKPAVVMFGESIATHVKTAAEEAVQAAGRLLVVGSSLATYSAWRLVKLAREQGKPIGIVNLGGVRGEENFYPASRPAEPAVDGFRCNESATQVLPMVVDALRAQRSSSFRVASSGTCMADQILQSTPLRTPS